VSIKQQALATWRATRSIKSDSGSGAHLYHMATFLHCQSKAPPPITAYEAWLSQYHAEHNPSGRGVKNVTGSKLRRAVVMRRNGCGLSEVGSVIGMGSSALKRWLDMLPPELAA
jgi:hypothetical protein